MKRDSHNMARRLGARRLAVAVLELDRRMLNPEVVMEPAANSLEQAIAGRNAAHDEVSGQRALGMVTLFDPFNVLSCLFVTTLVHENEAAPAPVTR